MTIRRLLVANRGEIARRIFRTCRALGIDTVAVFSPADADLPFVAEADLAVALAGNAPSASYLDAAAVLDAARRAGADAIHPGYGFLSENAEFAQAVRDAGLIWVGPPPDAIRAMGSKAAARALAASLGVPTVPGWSGPGEEATDERLLSEASRIGPPLLIKAAAGGGGRGMRRIDDLAALPAALTAARHEARSAFGDDTLLIERYVGRPRHIEVQVAADQHGAIIHLGERECSIQRRFQKIIEEAPSPGVDADRRARLGEAAVRLTRAVGYEGVGTLEFLLDERGEFYFLEMNTRLQVEHPVTERVTGVDLVAVQLRVAEGRPLGLDAVPLRGHAIEARIYAEDPNRDWLPGAGRLVRLAIPDDGDVRVDAGFGDGDVVSVHYDAMLAKVIAWGEDRADATRRLARALGRAWAPGVTTNLPLLRDILAHPAWQAADLDTAFLSRAGLPGPVPLAPVRGAIAATAIAWGLRRAEHLVQPGFRISGPAWQRDAWQQLDQVVPVAWRAVGSDRVEIRIEDHDHLVTIHDVQGDTWTVTCDGLRTTWRAAWDGALTDGAIVYLHLGDAEAVMQLVPRFPAPALAADAPGTAVAPTPGVVTRVHVGKGDVVAAGALLVTLEAMKMEHRIVAAEAGEVSELRVAPGDAVEAGAVLARIRPTDPA